MIDTVTISGAGRTVTLDHTTSALIDELLEWTESPAALLRAQGQQPLFEVAS